MNTTPARKRATLKIVLAGVAIVGVGAAVTTAVWTDDVLFNATATASSFDLQHSADGVNWFDDGVPGDDLPVTITATGLDTLSPEASVDVPFYLCNVGTVDGIITDITEPVIDWPEAEFPVGTLTVTATVTPFVDDELPADAPCASPVAGTLVVATTAAFPPEAQGTSGTITFTVTGESS